MSGQLHDAGYDAFMTGYAFLCIAKYIEIGKIIASYHESVSSSQVATTNTTPSTGTNTKPKAAVLEEKIKAVKKGNKR